MLRVFLLLFLEAKTSEILEWRQRMSYNFTRVYEKVCKFFETRRWFGSESSVPCPLFFSFLLFFDITFLIADFILYFIFFLPRVCVKKSDAIDTRNTMLIYLLCVYSISEIWENKFETFLFLCCLLKTFLKESIFHYTRFLDSERKYCQSFVFVLYCYTKSFVLLYKRDRIRIILKCNDFTHLRSEKVEISSF